MTTTSTDGTTERSAACPDCGHSRHLPGTECEAPVQHGSHHMHVCLCLARPGAARACPPQMTCQGGTLGYSDIWYLQHGHSLMGPDGEISPEALRVEPRGPVAASGPDTLPQWLYQRFARDLNVQWDDLADDNQSYWAHEAAAVRRAVARGGFKADGSAT